MLHLCSGTPPELIAKMGGWSPKSSTIMRSYVRVGHSTSLDRLMVDSKAREIVLLASGKDSEESGTED